MSGDSAHENNYYTIFIMLAVLTAVEVGVPMVITASVPKIAILVTLAVIKAGMVALYFMHLRFEKKTLGIIAILPMIICSFLLFMLMPDSSWRWIG